MPDNVEPYDVDPECVVVCETFVRIGLMAQLWNSTLRQGLAVPDHHPHWSRHCGVLIPPPLLPVPFMSPGWENVDGTPLRRRKREGRLANTTPDSNPITPGGPWHNGALASIQSPRSGARVAAEHMKSAVGEAAESLGMLVQAPRSTAVGAAVP